MPAKKTLTEADLAQFTGTENYYKQIFGLLYTDGVKYVAESAGAYWLIDAIASHQPDVRRKGGQAARDFQLWTLRLNTTEDGGGTRAGATLECRGDTDGPVWARQEILFTDFPLPEIQFYVEGGVLLLPSEH